ncbi:bifunctional diguanylate cyclase/phosphodiesterase [Pseudoxanthomonas suwonensis]|uniref:bifunctional diguanylate cyclase/phosphodiesterase n=1 Tax=Pseudoxanthomonas suwonensis TaxID=314722 RepID=UPI00138F2F24|nr:EAL domain-containing protein [Pseudoxanthomonas suwonensis]KAF1701454.1 bifunctional diguanylate cyclase/phosphodiesterase [Pseudoxanthomonas suwonensis]
MTIDDPTRGRSGDAETLRAPRLAPRTWALLVLAGGLLCTAEAARRELAAVEADARVMHESMADTAREQMAKDLGRAAFILRAMQTVLLGNDQIDQAVFDRYQRNLRLSDRLRGHVVTAFARRHPGPSYPYELVSPLEGNEVLLGFDAATQPENRRALELARDTDTIAMSAPIPLVQFQDGEHPGMGVIVRLPVYSHGSAPTTLEERRQRELGALAISLRVAPMLQGVLDGRIRELMQAQVRDLDLPGDGLVYATDDPGARPPADAQRRLVEFGGRRWELVMWPRPGATSYSSVVTTAVAGTVISLLLALLLGTLAYNRRRAVELGLRMGERFGESEARFQVLNELLPALVLLADARDGRVAYANQAARRHLGAVNGCGLTSLFADPALGQQAVDVAAAGGDWSGREALIVPVDGEPFWAHASLARVVVDGVPHLLMVANDVSEQRKLTERLGYQAAHDELTGLYNRREFERRLQKALAGLEADSAASFAVLYIDLDQFKLVNDLSGHMAGDQLLVELVHSMRTQLRPQDLLARLGGDEFGLLAPATGPSQARALAERMRQCIEEVVFPWEGRTYTVSASIGVVVADQPGATLKDILAWADSACYQAKENGRNRVHLYLEDVDTTRRQGEMEWATRLRRAMEEDRLLLDYQEVVPLAPEPGDHAPRIELLLRLRDEFGNEVAPGAFLPAAERYGLMPAIDRWVIRTALAHADRLHPRGSALCSFAINLSGASIEDQGLADYILSCIAEYGVAAERVCLEITETVAVRNLRHVVPVIERLRAAGCRIALDDFGAGMSSFGYLKNLPVDIIKIDGSFIRDLESDPVSGIIVSAIAQIGHQRGLRVVAEWVDDPRMLPLLRGHGVDLAQGFALHRPERVMFQRGRRPVLRA